MIGTKCCQSCGLPWDKDPQGGGTEANGTKNDRYCSYCYQSGSFVQPEWTASDMQQYVMGILTKRGFPEMMARIMVKIIPSLQRWKNIEPTK
jgi:hypothetical protein